MVMIRPQEGPQTKFLSTPASICIYGGAAGGGKSYGLLLSPLRYKNVQGFGCTIFRQNFNQIYSTGGLWDESVNMYGGIKGTIPKWSTGKWLFTDKEGNIVSKVTFAHIEKYTEVYKWQGSQITMICFDELTHFSEKTFFYMLSRNRSTCGVEPLVRATCNPDADSWVSRFISWWIDPDTGYPIPSRSGKLRWFVRRGEKIYWANTREELCEQFHLVTEEEKQEPRSVTFIMSKLSDNKILMKINPTYLANLKALPEVERERLLYGNWKIKPAAGLYFKRSQVRNYLDKTPLDVVSWVRGWDLAATSEDENGEPAYTAGVLIGMRSDKTYVVADVINVRKSANDVRQLILHTAQQDKAKYKFVTTRLPQDPGQAGKAQAQDFVRFLSGFPVKAIPESGTKESRAEPFASQWQGGNVDIVVGDWNEQYLDQLEGFPMSRFKDMVDASSSAFTELQQTFDLKSLIS